jgi:hypothetical protein
VGPICPTYPVLTASSVANLSSFRREMLSSIEERMAGMLFSLAREATAMDVAVRVLRRQGGVPVAFVASIVDPVFREQGLTQKETAEGGDDDLAQAVRDLRDRYLGVAR